MYLVQAGASREVVRARDAESGRHPPRWTLDGDRESRHPQLRPRQVPLPLYRRTSERIAHLLLTRGTHTVSLVLDCIRGAHGGC